MDYPGLLKSVDRLRRELFVDALRAMPLVSSAKKVEGW